MREKHLNGGKKSEDGSKMNKKLLLGIIGGFAALLLLIFVGFKIFGNFGEGGKGSYDVPDILGYTVEQAEKLPGVKDIFKIEVLGSKPSDKYQPGQIIEQDPTKGHTRKNNLTIKVYLCAEQEKYFMPQLRGYDARDAQLQLDKMDIKLVISVQEAYDDQVPQGKVISTTPESGAELKKGDNVEIVVSKGKETKSVTVPSFLGMDASSAEQQAANLGLSVGQFQYVYSDKEEGKVIDQSLSVNSSVDEGTTIVFTVSQGPESKQPEMVQKTVTFYIPDGYDGTEDVTVDFWQGGEKIASTPLSAPQSGAAVSYTFTGEKGSYSYVKAMIGEKEIGSQEITFE